MASEVVPLGMNAKLYINLTNTFVVPANITDTNTVVEVSNVRDLSLSLDKAMADVTTRGNGGWRAEVGTLKTGSVEYEMVADPEEAHYTYIVNAWLADTPVQFAVMSGDISSPSDAVEGLVAVFSIKSVSRAEPLEGAQMSSVAMSPTYVTNTSFKPAWKEVAGV